MGHNSSALWVRRGSGLVGVSWRDLHRLGGLTSRKWINFERMTEVSEKPTLQGLDCKPYESTPHRPLQFDGSLHLPAVRWIALICNIQINVDTREFRDVAIAVARVGLPASLRVSSGT